MVALFAAGLAMEQFGIAWDVSLQEHVPPERLARVYAYDMLGSFVAIPIGQIAVGPLAEAYGAPATLTGAAVLVVVATAGALCSRSVRHVGPRRCSETAATRVPGVPTTSERPGARSCAAAWHSAAGGSTGLAERRGDDAWLSAAWAAPTTRVLVVDDGEVPVDDDGDVRAVGGPDRRRPGCRPTAARRRRRRPRVVRGRR